MENVSDIAAWIDRSAIRSLIDLYTDAINRQRWDALPDMFIPSAVWRAAEPFALKFAGREAVIDALREMVRSHEFVVQQNGSVVIELDGARARARVNLSEFGREPTGQGLLYYGTYVDALVKTDGVWRFEQRTFHCRYADAGIVAGRLFPVNSGS